MNINKKGTGSLKIFKIFIVSFCVGRGRVMYKDLPVMGHRVSICEFIFIYMNLHSNKFWAFNKDLHKTFVKLEFI